MAFKSRKAGKGSEGYSSLIQSVFTRGGSGIYFQCSMLELKCLSTLCLKILKHTAYKTVGFLYL